MHFMCIKQSINAKSLNGLSFILFLHIMTYTRQRDHRAVVARRRTYLNYQRNMTRGTRSTCRCSIHRGSCCNVMVTQTMKVCLRGRGGGFCNFWSVPLQSDPITSSSVYSFYVTFRTEYLITINAMFCKMLQCTID